MDGLLQLTFVLIGFIFGILFVSLFGHGIWLGYGAAGLAAILITLRVFLSRRTD